jgi:hypothetical protein
MESEFFNFDPTDYQVLEDIEFDETIQRPEKIRFFTLTEQTTDAYEKLMPRGRVTRFQREEVRKEIERLQDLYGAYVIALPEDYRLREPSYGKQFTWIHPVYVSDALNTYDWSTQYLPLFENVRLPGFYPRFLTALPRPYGNEADGIPYDITTPTDFVNTEGKKPNRALPRYEMTRTQRHEDKTIDVVRVPMDGTEDIVRFAGYFLEKRPLDIPNPLADHPFLKSNEANFVETTSQLNDVVPSLDAILTHGVPVTKDPYVEGTEYLKLYDVKLQDIPWSAWKSKFPPVDIINEAPAGEPIDYPKPAQLAPPENVIEAYKSSYNPGVSVRLWLMNQLDGGGLIQELLRSQVIDNGSVESVPGVDLEQAAYPESSLEECQLTGKTFQDFLITGNLRRNVTIDKKDNFTIKYQCVPLEFVKQERARAGYLNRKPWAETTGDDIKKAYIRRLEEVRPVGDVKEKTRPVPKTPQRPDSVRRAEVLAILEDPRRFADDKLKDIQEILRETSLTNNIYSDTDGLFVACAHTLAMLGGDLEADRLKYYETWTARVNGFRVCKFCGEQINSDVYVDQVQFDEDGMLIRRAEALQETTFHGAGVRSFAKGLESLRPLFVDGSAHDDMVLLILTVLQVLPTASKLEPLLKFGRSVASIQFSKGAADQIAKFTGITGIATAALLLQTHIPTLIPRRSFGTKPLMLSGYPRDSDKPGDYTIADSLIMVLRKTFESFPTSFKGPAQQSIRAVLNKPSEVRTAVLNLLSAKSPLLKGFDKLPSPVPVLLTQAKAYHVENPVKVEAPKTLIPVLPPPKELGVINSFTECPSSRPVWTSGRPPQVVQATIQLRNGIQAASNGKRVLPSVSDRVVPEPMPKDQIRGRLAKEKGIQARIPIRDTPLANLAVASRVSDMFFLNEPVRAVDPTEGASTLRDISRGLLAETLAEVQKDPVKRTKLEEQRTKDIALYTLTADYKQEKANVNKLVASERMRFVQRMAQKTDTEREIIQDLLRIGLAPYIISRSDREELARESERLREEVFRDEALVQEMDAEVGVGEPRDVFEQGEEGVAGVDHGDYGDYVAIPRGEDFQQQPQITDDQERSI